MGLACGAWRQTQPEDPSDRSVWSHLVVVLAPDGDDLAGLRQGFEPVLVVMVKFFRTQR